MQLVAVLVAAGNALAPLTVAFGRLAGSRADPRRAATAFAAAGVVTAVGTPAGQVLDEIARIGLQGVQWHGAAGIGRLGAGGGFTFQFGRLAVAVGGLAVAAVVARQAGPSAAPSS